MAKKEKTLKNKISEFLGGKKETVSTENKSDETIETKKVIKEPAQESETLTTNEEISVEEVTPEEPVVVAEVIENVVVAETPHISAAELRHANRPKHL